MSRPTTADSQTNGKGDKPRGSPVGGESPGAQAFAALREALGTDLWLVDTALGEVIGHPHRAPKIDWLGWAATLRHVQQNGQPRWVEEEDPLAVLALPLNSTPATSNIGVALVVTRPLNSEADVTRAAKLLGVETGLLFAWAQRLPTMSTDTAERLANLALRQLAANLRVGQLEQEVHALSHKIGATYEEISLIYRLTQNLKLSGDQQSLAAMSLDWLADVVPAQGLVIRLLDDERDRVLPPDSVAESPLICHGNCPLDLEEFNDLVSELELDATARPVVINHATNDPKWRHREVRELILVSLAEGSRVFGWLAAFNHTRGHEFGTVEASLMSSIGTLLGIHASNVDLYRQQAQLLADVVRAMSSSIDAKDPYTRGHSNRVARVAVRLAQDLGCDHETIKTIYLSGLLHDIGKIGIDDNVLRKPGKLTEAEFEHVKTHVQIGYKILKDIRKMGHMLPVVLHHHESWNGAGYPHGLKGDDIPYLARIVAVADAYDAMASDRPYRQGMPDSKIDEILRRGAGVQWDARIVEAYFRCRDDIREISHHEIDHNELAALQWT